MTGADMTGADMTGAGMTGAGGATGAPSEVELLATVLRAAHAAVYGYGVLGARLDDDSRRTALVAYDGHRSRRDQLVTRLRERGAQVPVSEPAYDVSVSGPVEALTLAIRLEEGMAVRWRDLVAGTDDAALRGLAAAGLTETAVRAARWRLQAGRSPATVALPGTA